jgi:hypothetical protein
MTAPPPKSLNEAVIEIEQRIARTRIQVRPFPHIVIDDLLSLRLRRQVDQYWPNASRLASSNFFRRGELLVSSLAQTSDGDEQTFWRTLRAVSVRSNRAVRARLQRHFADKFRPLIGPGWRRALNGGGYLDNDAMLADYSGVVDLVPHVDHARVVVNGFVYLDDPDQPTPDPRRGTMLYHSNGFAWPSNKVIPKAIRDRFLREAVDIGWRDNRLLAYLNGPWSFHGVPRHDLGTARRRLLMFGSLLDQETMVQVYDTELQ